MATSNTPEHDFAPAWLKIPSPDQRKSNPKSSGISSIGTTTSNRTHKEDKQSQNYYGPDYSRLQRQHSFDTYYDGNNGRYIGSDKNHQYSVDDDYYMYQYAAYYNGYGYDKYGKQYNSQPSLRSQARDGKYQQPNARFGGVNGLYSKSGNCDLYPYDYYAGDAYYGYPGCAGSKRGYHEKDGRNTQSHEAKNSADKDKIMIGEDNRSFNEDFPSLNGHSNGDEMKSNRVVNGGVWENRSLNKMTTLSTSSVSSSKSNEQDMNNKEKVSNRDVFMRPPSSTTGVNIYKSLVPNKGPMHSRRNPRDSVRLNGITSKDPSNGKPASHNGSPSSVITKEVARQSPTPPLDILNTRLITQPRTLADKKSDFLKALRKTDNSGSTDNSSNEKQNVQAAEQRVNGVSTLTVDEPDPTILSSSLDAEKRLLREMGWDEMGEDDDVITEDDMKELQNLKQQVQQRNGMIRPLPKTWSPSHMPVYKEADLNETLSSSSDSDDSD